MRTRTEENESLNLYRETFILNTNFYCPKCGAECIPSDIGYEGDDIEPSSAALVCGKCGRTEIRRDDLSWTADGNIPYIPGMETNSATLLYRYGDRIPDSKEEFDELIDLLVDVSNGYRDCCDLEGQLETELRLNRILREAIIRQYDYGSQIFLNMATIVQCYNDLGEEAKAETVIDSGLELCMNAHVVDACTFMLMMTEFELSSAIAEKMKRVYVKIRDSDVSKVDNLGDTPFSRGMFYNVLSEVARHLGLESDFEQLLDMSLRSYLEGANPKMTESDLSMIAMCFESNLTFVSRSDRSALADKYVEFADRYRSIDDIHYYNALLRRHIIEEQKWNDFHGKDEDLDKIIERFEDTDDCNERYLLANALFLRSVFNIDDMSDLTAAYNAIKANLFAGDEFDDLACSIIKSYITRLKKTDAARYKFEVKTLASIGLSMDTIDRWYRDMTSE